MKGENSKQELPKTERPLEQVDAVSCAEKSAAIEALARRYRRIGYTIFGLLALFTAVFLFSQVLTSLRQDAAWDPFTGERVGANEEPK